MRLGLILAAGALLAASAGCHAKAPVTPDDDDTSTAPAESPPPAPPAPPARAVELPPPPPISKDAYAADATDCDGKTPDACAQYAYRSFRNSTDPALLAKAAKLYMRACAEGSSAGCNNLGFAYMHGTGVALDETRGASYFKQQCDKGYEAPCNNLASAYEAGRGVPKDVNKAKELYRDVCDPDDDEPSEANEAACRNLKRLEDE